MPAGFAPPAAAAIAGLLNFRDLGGLPVEADGRIRAGRLYRSACPDTFGSAGLKAIRALRLRTVLDLRDEYERVARPYELGDPRIARLNTPVLGGRPVPPDQPGLYAHMAGECGARFTAAVRALARRDALPALVHCAVGKDRTGVVVALALSAVGVPDGTVVEDYLLSNAGLGLAAPDPAGPPDLYQTGRHVSARLIEDVLARARRRGGDVPGFLALHGMTDAELASLREALVSPLIG